MLERHADGEEVDLESARKLTEEALRSRAGYGPFAPRAALQKGKPHLRAQDASVWAARLPAIQVSANGVNGDQQTFTAGRRAQVELFRDIFGNPFRPVALDPRWLTSTVGALAGGIYDEFAFDRLPILADALIDAGCEDEGILTHCRSGGAHARGCWLVDLL